MTQQAHDPIQGQGQTPSSIDQILDLLLDALADRQRARQAKAVPPRDKAEPEIPLSPLASLADRAPQPAPLLEREVPPTRPEPPPAEQKRTATPPGPAPQPSPLVPKPEPLSGEKGWQPPAQLPSINVGKLLGRLAILVAILVVVINIPVKSHGVSLARILPDTASLVIRDGLVLKGSGTEIYRLEDNKLRWISSMDAFEHLGLTWKDVHVVDDGFLEQFEMGHPIHLILKCQNSPHIYALENGKKRWIKDIQTFTVEGYVWDDVQLVGCANLRNLRRAVDSRGCRTTATALGGRPRLLLTGNLTADLDQARG